MGATIEMPTLSQIESWSTAHLQEAATAWSGLAQRWEDAFTQIAEHTPLPGGTPWQGVGADAAAARTTADRHVVTGIADQLYTAARVARHGAEDVAGARQLALEAIFAAQHAGFIVTEDLSVSPPLASGLLHQTQLQAQAQVMAADIRTRAGELLAVDTQVGAGITSALEGVGFGADPVTPAPSSGVQAVDYHTFKQTPIPEPGPDPSVGGTPEPVSTLGLPNYNSESLDDEGARRVYAEGKLRIIAQDEELAKRGVSLRERAQISFSNRNALRSWIRDIMANRQGAEYLNQTEPNMTWDEVVAKYRGQGLTGDDLYNKILEKSVGSRAAVDARLGVDAKNPGELPAVRPSAPLNLPPVEPPRPVAEPVSPEVRPGEGGFRGGFGAPAGPVGPQLVPGPHSIHHPFPILGEDDPLTPPEAFEP